MFSPNDYTVRADPADAWWDANYDYRKSFNISGQTTTETYYQVRIVVHRSAGSDSGNDVYVSTKCEADYDDIRFTNDAASPTLCSYWIEESDSSSATIWVELDSITGSGTDTFYMYYGYASASAYSAAAITFYHYDDFDTDVYAKTGSSLDIDEGGDERVEWSSSASYGDGEHIISTIPTDEWAFEVRVEFSSMSGFSAARIFLVDISQSSFSWAGGTDGVGVQMWYSSYSFCAYALENGVAATNITSSWSLSTTYWLSVTFDGSEINAYLYSDYWETVALERQLTSISLTHDPDTIIFQNRDRTGCVGWADDFRIRKFVSEDPQPANWGSEEAANVAPAIEAYKLENPTSAEGNYWMLARYSKYFIEFNVTDGDGWDDIDFLVVEFWSNDRSVRRGGVYFEAQMNAWYSFDNYITRDVAYCENASYGNFVNVTFGIDVAFYGSDTAYGDTLDCDLYFFVNDTSGESDESWLELADGSNEVDVVRNIWTAAGWLSDDRGNKAATLTVSGTIYYNYTSGVAVDGADINYVRVFYSGDTNYQYDYDPTGAGFFEMTIGSPNSVTKQNYTLEINDVGLNDNWDDWAEYICDEIDVTFTAPTYTKLAPGYNASGFYISAIYDYDDVALNGYVTLNDTEFAHTVAGYYGYTVGSVTDNSYGITAFDVQSSDVQILWQTVNVTWSHFWTEYSESLWFAHIDLSDLEWSIEGTTIPNGITINLYENSSLFFSGSSSSGQVDTLEDYDLSWYWVNWTVKINYVNAPYNFTLYEFYSEFDSVPVTHTLYIEVWDIDWTDDYLYVTWETNWRNATLTMWDNTSLLDYFTNEGVSQITLSSTQGLHQIVFLINGSTHAEGTYDASFTDDDAWEWRFLNYSVSVRWTTLWMTFKRGTGEVIPWGTFIVEIDGYICPQSWIMVDTSSTVNVTVYDDFGQIVYQNTTYPTGSTENTHLRENLAVYILNLANQRNKPQYAIVTRNGDTWRSPDIGAYSSIPYLVYGSVTGVNYTVTWYRAEDDAFTDGFSWTVYTSDITAYSGWDIPIVIPPGIDPEPLIYAVQSTFFWTSFLQLIFILGGLAVLGAWLRKRKQVPTFPTVGEPEDGEPIEMTQPLTEREKLEAATPSVRDAGAKARTEREKAIEKAKKRMLEEAKRARQR